MNRVESVCGRIRHHRLLQGADWLWDSVRPLYNASWRWLGARGIAKTINGTDALRVSPRLRNLTDSYEPEVWRCLMRELRPGDVFVDVGAFIGLYTIAAAKRCGRAGRVYGFEPDPENYRLLTEHIRLNRLSDVIVAEAKAVSSESGLAVFTPGRGSESHLGTGPAGAGNRVPVTTLDESIKAGRMDVLKIDVEGFEQAVLEGASRLLADPRRKPRAIFMEAHPFAWGRSGASSAALLSLLERHGYGAFSTQGDSLTAITDYGEVVARIKNPGPLDGGRAPA